MKFASATDVAAGIVQMNTSAGELRTQQVLGSKSSLTVATRTPGYHSQPHAHDCEQLNYVTRGEVWVFVEHEAFHLTRGDFLRIPPSAMHWAWNRSDADVELVEVHTPGLLLDGVSAKLLVEDDEERADQVPSRWGPTDLWQRENAALAALGNPR